MNEHPDAERLRGGEDSAEGGVSHPDRSHGASYWVHRKTGVAHMNRECWTLSATPDYMLAEEFVPYGEKPNAWRHCSVCGLGRLP